MKYRELTDKQVNAIHNKDIGKWTNKEEKELRLDYINKGKALISRAKKTSIIKRGKKIVGVKFEF